MAENDFENVRKNIDLDIEKLEKQRLELRGQAIQLLEMGSRLLLDKLESITAEEQAKEIAVLQKLRRDITKFSKPNELPPQILERIKELMGSGDE